MPAFTVGGSGSIERTSSEPLNQGSLRKIQPAGGAGQPVDEPTGGDASHPRDNERDALAAEKEPMVFVAERAQHKSWCARGRVRLSRQSAEKAVQLEDTLSEAHASLAEVA